MVCDQVMRDILVINLIFASCLCRLPSILLTSILPTFIMPASSTDRRHRAGVLIRSRGVEMPYPCGSCERRSLRCFASASVGICSECYTYHRKCSLTVPRATWKRLQSEQKRLKAELERLDQEKQRLNKKKQRVQKRLRRVQNNERRLLSHELHSIKEMEDLEKADENELSENDSAVASDVQGSSSAPDPVDANETDQNETDLGAPSTDQPAFDPMSFENFDWSFDPTSWLDLADSGFDDEILRALEGNPSEAV
jgi:hypothetical protein